MLKILEDTALIFSSIGALERQMSVGLSVGLSGDIFDFLSTLRYFGVCWDMLGYVGVCWGMLRYVGV